MDIVFWSGPHYVFEMVMAWLQVVGLAAAGGRRGTGPRTRVDGDPEGALIVFNRSGLLDPIPDEKNVVPDDDERTWVA